MLSGEQSECGEFQDQGDQPGADIRVPGWTLGAIEEKGQRRPENTVGQCIDLAIVSAFRMRSYEIQARGSYVGGCTGESRSYRK